MGTNPYARKPGLPGIAPGPVQGLWANNARYTVPTVDTTNDPTYTLGFSPALKADGSSDGSALPDAIRIGRKKPPATEGKGTYNVPHWQLVQDSEQNRRYQEDHMDTMWNVQQRRVPPPNVPLWSQERAPIRPTATYSPTGYAVTRPWHIPRNIKDAVGPDATTHFSMADHRRKYAILTQKPQNRTGVNTYRATPTPWDANLFVAPGAPDARPVTNTATGGRRSFRLGG